MCDFGTDSLLFVRCPKQGPRIDKFAIWQAAHANGTRFGLFDLIGPANFHTMGGSRICQGLRLSEPDRVYRRAKSLEDKP